MVTHNQRTGAVELRCMHDESKGSILLGNVPVARNDPAPAPVVRATRVFDIGRKIAKKVTIDDSYIDLAHQLSLDCNS